MWRHLFRRRRMAEELDQEIRAHLAMAARDRVERGEVPEQACEQARRELGNELLIREVTRDIWGWASLDRFARDLKYVARQMKRNPGFTAIAVLTLALGLGAATAMFSIVNSVLLEPMKYRESGRLYLAQMVPPPQTVRGNWPVNARHFHEWRAHCRSCEGVSMVEGMGFTLTGPGEPERLPGLRVSYNFFRTLGVQPALGRDFLPEEELPGHFHVLILSDSLWRTHFAADPAIIGRTLQINGEPNSVVGVMAPDFHLPVGNEWGVMFANPMPPMIFRPLGMDVSQAHGAGMQNYASVIRLKPGASPGQAIAEMNSLIAEFVREFDIRLKPTLVPLQEGVTQGARSSLWLLLGMVGAVLLIVCVNVGNLMLVRTSGRDREAGIRMALGAGRGELFGLVLKEALILVASGSGLGLLLAHGALKAFLAAAPVHLPRMGEIQMDGRVLIFAIAAAAISTLISGSFPALRLARTEPLESLKTGSVNATEGGRKLQIREFMVGAEVAASTLLLVIGGLLMLSFVRVMRAPTGFEVAHVVTQGVSLIGPKYSDDNRTRFIDEALNKLRSIPGVESAGVTNQVPLRGETWIDGLREPDQPENSEPALANFRFVSPDYWKVMGIPLRQGRFFQESDRGRNVAILSERAAHLLWPDANPIGKRVHLTAANDAAGEVIGVVGDARASLERNAPLTVYEPYWAVSVGGPSFVLRTRAEPAAVVDAMRAALRSLDSNMPLLQAETMEQILDQSVSTRRFQTYLAMAFAAAALALASLGIYGVISFTVARRTPEMGIRTALGARPAQLMAMVVLQGLRPVLAGLAVGLAGALSVGRFLASELYGVTPSDPVTLATVTVLLLAVALCACWVPARRAARIDPLRALRCE